jgi:hypothetical protein
VDSRYDPVLQKYNPDLVYFDFGENIDKEKGEFFLDKTLLRLIVKSEKPIILTEDDFSIIIYKLDSIERDLSDFLHKNLTIKIKPIFRSIPDTGFIYCAGSKIRPKIGFLEVFSENDTAFYAAYIMKKPVKRI